MGDSENGIPNESGDVLPPEQMNVIQLMERYAVALEGLGYLEQAAKVRLAIRLVNLPEAQDLITAVCRDGYSDTERVSLDLAKLIS